MNHNKVLFLQALFVGVFLCINLSWAQEQSEFIPLEVEMVTAIEGAESFTFNNGRSVVIAVNREIPHIQDLKDSLVQSLGSTHMLDKVVFNWFGANTLQAIEVVIGVNVPLEISQSVLAVLSGEEGLPLIVSIRQEDGRHGDTQRVYVGSLVKSGRKPISLDRLNALLDEKILQEDFVKIITELE